MGPWGAGTALRQGGGAFNSRSCATLPLHRCAVPLVDHATCHASVQICRCAAVMP